MQIKSLIKVTIGKEKRMIINWNSNEHWFTKFAF